MDSLTILLASLLGATTVGLLRHTMQPGPKARRRIANAQRSVLKVNQNASAPSGSEDTPSEQAA